MLKPKLIKNWCLNIFLLLIVSIICLFLIELCLSLFFPQGDPLWGYDPFIGVKLEPNKCSRYISEEYNTKLCSNNEGFRDTNHDIEKNESTIRIAFLGDSFIAAKEVKTEDRFTNLMSSLIEQKCGKKIEVLNFGVAGQGTAGELLTWDYFVKKYNPDYTILVVFPENDVSNNYLPLENRNYIPTYKLDQSGELQYVPFKKAPLISNPVLSTISREMFPNLFSLSGKSFRSISRLIKGKEKGLPKSFYVYSANESEDYKVAWEIERKLLEKLKYETKSINSEFVVVLLFSRNQVTNFEDYSDNSLFSTFDISKPNIKFSSILEELNITYIDLFKKIDLQGKDNNYKPLFFEINQHLTEEGHRFITDLIVSDLLNETKICEK